MFIVPKNMLAPSRLCPSKTNVRYGTWYGIRIVYSYGWMDEWKNKCVHYARSVAYTRNSYIHYTLTLQNCFRRKYNFGSSMSVHFGILRTNMYLYVYI